MDFALRPENHADRRTLVRETAEEVRRLWRGEALSTTDGLGRPVDIRPTPLPCSPSCPSG